MNLTRWSLDPSLAYVGVAAGLYLLGSRGRGRPRPLQAASFFAGLLTIVIALDSPIDDYADQLFWVHMLQHVLLLTVAPPLFLLGRPWPTMWRALPLRPRTVLARTVARSGWTRPLRELARPLPAWILFNATVIAWHIPAAYDATLTNGVVHVCEHAMFFFTGLLFWARVIDPGPLRPRLVWPMRIGYTVGAMVVGWVLAITLVVVPHALYPYYTALASRPGGLTAMQDQQIAAGVMWVPGSIAYAITFLTGFYRWLEPDRSINSQSAAITT
ncbi:MAG TPA: cytochrome c oxidase assembly protein [Solirubrobacteraceae bacterium]|nr:cytochrome c oxidase assembly protein [Solirubrobacteraceae bacterium]